MSSSDVFIGTDIGTLGTKTLVVDVEGNILSSAFKEYDILTPHPLWAEQWPELWVNATKETIRTAIRTAKIPPKSIQGICISGLYGGSGIPCDSQMKPLRPCIIWMDRRATAEVQWIRTNIGEKQVFEITGNTIDTYYGYTKILWIKNNEPDIWQRTASLVTPNAYVIYCLTGEESIDYSSAGNLGGVYDIHKKSWSDVLLNDMGIPRTMFPEEISESAAVVGEVTAQMGKETGLPPGTPVCAGGIDAPVAAFSVGVTKKRQHAAMIGTSMCWNTVQSFDDMRLSPNLINYPHVADPQNRIYTFGGAATAGGIIHWYRENLARLELRHQNEVGESAYASLDSQAEKIPPGSEGIIVLPYFMGERTPVWNPWAKGVIIGLTLYHNYRHVYRAFLEGVAYALRHNIASAKQLEIPLEEEMRLVGGGGKSPLWRQIFADVTGIAIRYLHHSGGAPFGDAYLAALGTENKKSYEGINEWLTEGDRINPDQQANSVYNESYKIYLEVYERNKPIFDMLKK